MTCLSGKSSQVRNREKETTTRYRLHLQHHPCMHANNVKTSCTTILYNPRNRKKVGNFTSSKTTEKRRNPAGNFKETRKKSGKPQKLGDISTISPYQCLHPSYQASSSSPLRNASLGWASSNPSPSMMACTHCPSIPVVSSGATTI